MRKVFIFFLLFHLMKVTSAQDSTGRTKYGFTFDLQFSSKINSNYAIDQYGTDLIRSTFKIGIGGGIKFVVEFNETWGVSFKAGLNNFNNNKDKINEEMLSRLGVGFLGLGTFSLYGPNTSSHGLNLIELNACFHKIFFSENKFNFVIDGGFQYTSWHNPEYRYIYRTPSTNYYEYIDVSNKRSGLKPMANIGFSIRKSMVYENKPDEFRKGFIGLRLGAVYGFSYNDNYTIRTENHLGEITEIGMDIPVNIFYFNLGISITFI